MMLDADALFQSLLTAIPTTVDKAVAADLDVGSIELLPFVTHSSLFAQDRNGPGLYSLTLSVSLFIDETMTTETTPSELYKGIWGWVTSPTAGVVPAVGAVESILREISAFVRLTSGVQMLNTSVTQYVGSWELTVREL